MSIPAAFLAFVGFLSLGASFILQLLVALGLPYIKGIYFLRVNFNTGLRLTFGVWTQCLRGDGGVVQCAANGLGYQQAAYQNAIAPFFVNKLPYALVVQPVSAGFTGLAAGAAFLAMCTNTFLWPLAAIWASFLTMAALVIELVLFILACNKYRSYDQNTATGTDFPTSSELGPAIWMQVAALPPAFFGFMMLAAAWWIKRSRNNDNYYANDDYVDTARPVYPHEKDDYYQRAPSRNSRRSRYDDPYEYGNVARSFDRGYGRASYDDRPSRRSYAGDAYGSRTSLAPPAAAPYRGGRSRRYSERGAY